MEDNRKIVLATQKDADKVEEALLKIVRTYDQVTVADLNQLVGLPTTYSDHQWGWTEILADMIHKTEDGWVIELSSAKLLV